MENLKQFVDDLLEGKLEPYMKSEPVPSEQGDVKVAVAKNFKDLITNADKDVLIEFYAPWCGHCKSLAPKYEELATKVRKGRCIAECVCTELFQLSNEDVVIAKMDATANDVPPMFEVRGYDSQ